MSDIPAITCSSTGRKAAIASVPLELRQTAYKFKILKRDILPGFLRRSSACNQNTDTSNNTFLDERPFTSAVKYSFTNPRSSKRYIVVINNNRSSLLISQVWRRNLIFSFRDLNDSATLFTYSIDRRLNR